MLLSDAGDPIVFWQYAERYLGAGTRTYSSYAGDLEISPAYHPQLGAESFTVPSVRVPSGLGSYLRSAIPSPLHELYAGAGEFVLPVHPNALDFPGLVGRDLLAACAPGPEFEVVPSANARTVFVSTMDGVPVPPHFVKLHYPRRLSRFTRRLRRPVIGLQMWVAEELARVGAPVVPEVGGGFVGETDDAWGFLVRAAAPLDTAPPFVVPLFALYGGDFRAPEDPTLLEQLVAASGAPAARFIAERIVEPMVRLWVRVALGTGCSLETHGQNTLFAFSADGRDTRVLYRDCAVYVDAGIRQRLGLRRPLPPTNVIGRDVLKPTKAVFSLGFDSFMGHHALSYVAALAERRLGVDPALLRGAGRRAFAEECRSEDLLPATVFYYENALYADGGWELVDTGEWPLWR